MREVSQAHGGRAGHAAELSVAVEKARDYLLARQDAAGFWCGELEGDTILESEYILLLAFLGEHETPRAGKAAAYLLEKQLPEGGWAQYPGGEMDQSGSVKAYFALKLTGHNPDAPYMQAARRAIRDGGGADAVNSFTRFYLALLGQISYEQCPAVPPEAMLLPSWAPINIYKISAWSRTILVPLAIMWAHRPVRRLPAEQGIAELFLQAPRDWPPLRCPGLPQSTSWFSWERTFRGLDRFLKLLEQWRIRPLRGWALKRAEQWMLARFEKSDGLGAIFPPMVWSIIALRCLGYSDDSPQQRYCRGQLDGLAIETETTLRLQPCKSPVWDTAIALRGLAAADVRAGRRETSRSLQWLLDKEVTQKGDWASTVNSPPGGWFFEHENAFYPDADDTAMVLLALAEQLAGQVTEQSESPGVVTSKLDRGRLAEATAGGLAEARRTAALLERAMAAGERGRKWLEAMQNRDGGWGAFDRNNDAEFLCYVPFADHNAMIDPSTPDLAARVLESLAPWGVRRSDPRVERAIAYLRRSQQADGSWFGRWGVNYIYGTWQVLVGLRAIGVASDDPMVVRGADWLERFQQDSGGWGESADSYARPELRGRGPTTASQTAWAVLGLIAAGRGKGRAVARGVEYLMQRQRADGGWDETEFTGTGFPRVFYLRYHLYPIYFPLLAMAQFAQLEQRETGLASHAV